MKCQLGRKKKRKNEMFTIILIVHHVLVETDELKIALHILTQSHFPGIIR
jgi:hypothetical protein